VNVSKEERLEAASDILSQTWVKLELARETLKRCDYYECVKISQEAFELGLKGIFTLFGIGYHRNHDPGKELHKVWDKIPYWKEKDRVAKIVLRSQTLTHWRNPATYGVENLGVQAKRLFDEHEANLALRYASDIHTELYALLTRRRSEPLPFE